jgi:hypothetical protein
MSSIRLRYPTLAGRSTCTTQYSFSIDYNTGCCGVDASKVSKVISRVGSNSRNCCLSNPPNQSCHCHWWSTHTAAGVGAAIHGSARNAEKICEKPRCGDALSLHRPKPSVKSGVCCTYLSTCGSIISRTRHAHFMGDSDCGIATVSVYVKYKKNSSLSVDLLLKWHSLGVLLSGQTENVIPRRLRIPLHNAFISSTSVSLDNHSS